MSTLDAEEPQGSVSPADNLDEWLRERNKRDAEPEAETAESTEPASPAEPSVAQTPDEPDPEDYTEPWWEQGLAEAKHGFLRGRKGPEVEKAFRHVETAKQRAEREAAELRQQVEQMRIERAAEAAVQRVTGQPQAQPQPDDPYQRLESAFWEQPGATFQQLEALAAERAKREMWQELQAAQQANEAEYRQQAGLTAGRQAVQEVARLYNLDEAAAEARVMGTFTLMAADDDADFADPRWYVHYARQLYGDPPPVVPQVPVSPVTEIPDPPGSKRPSSVSSRQSKPSVSISSEEEATRSEIARIAGLDPERFLKRGATRA